MYCYFHWQRVHGFQPYGTLNWSVRLTGALLCLALTAVLLSSSYSELLNTQKYIAEFILNEDSMIDSFLFEIVMFQSLRCHTHLPVVESWSNRLCWTTSAIKVSEWNLCTFKIHPLGAHLMNSDHKTIELFNYLVKHYWQMWHICAVKFADYWKRFGAYQSRKCVAIRKNRSNAHLTEIEQQLLCDTERDWSLSKFYEKVELSAHIHKKLKVLIVTRKIRKDTIRYTFYFLKITEVMRCCI